MGPNGRVDIRSPIGTANDGLRGFESGEEEEEEEEEDEFHRPEHRKDSTVRLPVYGARARAGHSNFLGIPI